MSTTLRRKMFKMGGSTNTHGVGITSGLQYRKGMNQGGRVDRGIVGYQPKNHPARQGNREGHSGYAIPFYNAIGLPAAKALLNMLKKRSLEPAKQFINKKILRETGKGKGFTMLDEVDPSALIKLYRGAQLAAPVGIAGGAGGAGLGLLMAGLDRAGLEEGNDDSLLESAARTIGKFGLNASIPGAATALTGALFDTEEKPRRKSLYNILAGNQLAKEDKEDPPLDTRTVAEKEAEAYEEMKTEASQRAEMMYEMLNGGVNKMAAISAGLAAATPYIANEQYAEGAAAFTQGLQPELQKDENLRQQIGGQVLSEMEAEKQEEDKYVNALIGSGDAATATSARRLFKAEKDIGLANTLGSLVLVDGEVPVDKVGIYVDSSNLTGKLYVVVNKDKEVEGFDTIDEATEYLSN